MSRTRSLLIAVVALALAVLLVFASNAGSGDAPDAAPRAGAPSPSDDPRVEVTTEQVPPPPPLAACYRLGLDSATRATSSSRPVPCREPHTARTIHVGRLDLTPQGRRVGVDSPGVQRQLARVCPVELRRYLGGTTDVRRRSRFEVVWFSPTLEQVERGARWFRCDAVVVADEGRLLRLPADLRGVLDRPGALATYGLCGTAQPGTRGFRRVACALPHTWQAISTIDLPGGRRYPGSERVRATGEQACADQVRERSGLVLEFSYGWEWPTRAQWAAGQHYGYCWAPDRD